MGKIVLYEKKGTLNVLEHFHMYNKLENVDRHSRKSKYGYFKFKKQENISDEDVRKYYADKTKTLTIIHAIVEVVQDGDKVSIRFKYVTRTRQKGAQYFTCGIDCASFISKDASYNSFASFTVSRIAPTVLTSANSAPATSFTALYKGLLSTASPTSDIVLWSCWLI